VKRKKQPLNKSRHADNVFTAIPWRITFLNRIGILLELKQTSKSRNIRVWKSPLVSLFTISGRLLPTTAVINKTIFKPSWVKTSFQPFLVNIQYRIIILTPTFTPKQ
jgi:hypothetical protein